MLIGGAREKVDGQEVRLLFVEGRMVSEKGKKVAPHLSTPRPPYLRMDRMELSIWMDQQTGQIGCFLVLGTKKLSDTMIMNII